MLALDFIPFQESDINILVDFMRKLYEFDRKPDSPLPPFKDVNARKAAKELLIKPLFGGIWLLKLGAAHIGHLILTVGFSLEFAGNDMFIDELFIEEAYRGKGLGKQALAFAQTQADQSGIQAIHLEVERANIIAQEIYRKFGFVNHDRYLMTKWL